MSEPAPKPQKKVYWRFRYLVVAFVSVLSVEMCASAAPEPTPSNPSVEPEVPEAFAPAADEAREPNRLESAAEPDEPARLQSDEDAGACSIPPPTSPPPETCDE